MIRSALTFSQTESVFATRVVLQKGIAYMLGRMVLQVELQVVLQVGLHVEPKMELPLSMGLQGVLKMSMQNGISDGIAKVEELPSVRKCLARTYPPLP